MADWERMTTVQILEEVQKGGRFVVYHYCVSVIIVTMRRPTEIQFVPAGHSRVAAGLPYTFASLVAGWWGFPWGFIYTPITIITNTCGGTDVTDQIVGRINERLQRAAATEASAA
jgi:hypothetical protein